MPNYSSSLSDKVQQSHIYTITLTQNYSFHSIQRDLPTLYNNFCILSYMSRRCLINIYQRYYYQNYTIDEFSSQLIKNERLYLYRQRNKKLSQVNLISGNKQTKDQQKDLNITYTVSQQKKQIEQVSSLTTIKCKFATELKNNIEYIHIEITDEKSWLSRIFDIQNLSANFDRIHDHRFLRNFQLQYFWVQPKNQRHKSIPGKHIALALQGGGVKGISYIGAIKAIRKQIGGIKISSVIGSSAGGILSLAICCGLGQQQISKLFIENISHITLSDLKYKAGSALQNYLADQKKYKRILAKFLLNFGIIDSKLFQIIVDSITDFQIEDAVIQVLEVINPAFRDMLSFKVKDGKRRLLLYGLLKGKILTGQTLKTVAKKALNIFREQKQIKTISQNYEEWAEKITLKQFYELNGIEFTCTSVDLKNHILRFFNHKTTPDLPVCQAILMTGAFPVVFQSQKWSTAKWGKYYVHYQLSRKQIDLDGCQFTDGGVLANFPIKYLDNQKMRPMYFSHKTAYSRSGSVDPDYSQTILYGFGLNQIKKMQDEQKNLLSQKLKSLGTKIIERVDRKKIFGNILYRLITPQPVIKAKTQVSKDEDIFEIPLFNNLQKLLKTYRRTKDNLTKQCFATDICTTLVESSLISLQDGTISKDEDFIIGMNKLYKDYNYFIIQYLQTTMKNSNPLDILTANLQYIKSYINQVPYLQYNALFIEQTISHIITTYLHFSENQPENLTNIVDIHHKLQAKMLKCQQQIRHSAIFMNSYIKQDFQILAQIVQEDLIPFFKSVKANLQTKNQINSKIKLEAYYVQATLNKIRDYQYKNYIGLAQEIRMLKQRVEKNTTESKFFLIDQDILFKIFEIKKNILTTVPLSSMKNFIQQGLISSKLAQLTISFNNYENKRQILGYIKKLIIKQYETNKNPGIHLILQSKKLSEIYFHEFMGFTKIAINQLNNQLNLDEKSKLYIQSQSGSDYHAVALFLHASDFSNKKITQQIWKIKDLIIMNPNIQKHWDKKMWAKSNLQRIKQIRDYIWENKYDIFKEIQFTFKAQKFATNFELDSYFKDKFENAHNFIDDLNEGMQTSLNYVIDSIYNLQEKEIIDKKIKEIQKKLILNLSPTGAQVLKEFKDISNGSAKIGLFFLSKYIGVIKYILYQWHQNVIFHLKESQRKQIWKGLIMGQALTGIRLKKYIFQKLQELGLKPNTTLQQFYNLSHKKIHVNFMAVQTSSNAITFLNRKTAPYMPVWAAILATSSHPLLFRPLPNRSEWNYLPIQKYEQRIVKQYFTTDLKSKSFQSSGNLLKIPLQLVTNHRIKQIITYHQHEIYICLSFQVINSKIGAKSNNIVQKMPLEEQSKIKIWKKMVNKPITIYDLLFRLNVSIASLSLLSTIPAISYRLNLIQLFLNSHDNLITKIYSKQLVKLPVRIGTLDFNEIVDVNGKKSKIFMQTVMQSYYVSLENIKNSNLKSDQTKIMYIKVENYPKKTIQSKVTYFSPRKILATQLGSPRNRKNDKKYNQSPTQNSQTQFDDSKQFDCVIRFLSFHQNARSILEKFKIFCQIPPQTGYKQITDQHFYIKFKQNQVVNIRIDYPQIYTGDDLHSSQSLKLLQYDVQFNQNSSIRKQTKYFQLSLQKIMNSLKQSNRFYANCGFVYSIQFNRFTLQKDIYPQQGEVNKVNIKDLSKYPLGIRSIVSKNDLEELEQLCIVCSRNVISFTSFIQKIQEESIPNLQTKNKICAYCQIPQRKTVLVCPCSAQYCIKCKYILFVENNQLKCPLSHTLKKQKKFKIFDSKTKNAMLKSVKTDIKKKDNEQIDYQQKKQMILSSVKQAHEKINKFESICQICQKISSHDFYYDEKCDVRVCESCCLKIFSTK